MRLNADLGEHFGDCNNPCDEKIMPYIDQANIACGYHAGNAYVMQQTLSLTKQHNVAVGAHVSYPDLEGFGRRSMQFPAEQLIAIIHAQIAVLEGMAACQQQQINHIKPHGALYNDMMSNNVLFETIVRALSLYKEGVTQKTSQQPAYPLMIQALVSNDIQNELANQYQVPLIYEAFADRAYDDNGFLVSRSIANSVLNKSQALEQVSLMLQENTIKSIKGKFLNIKADTICVHSDTPSAIVLCEKISGLVQSHNKQQLL